MSKNKTSVTKNSEATAHTNVTTTGEDCKTTDCKTGYCKKTLVIILLSALVIIGILYVVKSNKTSQGEKEVRTIDKNESVKTAGDVEEVVAQWVANNPELILESVINMQKKQAQQQTEDAGKNIEKKAEELYNKDSDPVHNANNYDVSIIEFFDYNCGYCKRAVATLEKLAAEDKKVRIIFKELPILGQSSEDLSRVALAFNIANPGKYFEFHTALMKSSARTTEEAIKISESKGVSGIKIKAIMAKFKGKIDEEIANNRKLAESVGINGTPAFLVEKTLFPGAVDFETLEAAINKARNE